MGSCKSKTRKPITFDTETEDSSIKHQNDSDNDHENETTNKTHLHQTVDQIFDEGIEASSRQRKNSSTIFGMWKLNKEWTNLSSGDDFKFLLDDVVLYIIEIPKQDSNNDGEDRYKLIISMEESDRMQRNDIEFTVKKRASGWSGEGGGKVDIKRRKSLVDPIEVKRHSGNLQEEGDEPSKELERLEKELTKLLQFPDVVIASKVLITISKGSYNARFNIM